MTKKEQLYMWYDIDGNQFIGSVKEDKGDVCIMDNGAEIPKMDLILHNVDVQDDNTELSQLIPPLQLDNHGVPVLPKQNIDTVAEQTPVAPKNDNTTTSKEKSVISPLISSAKKENISVTLIVEIEMIKKQLYDVLLDNFDKSEIEKEIEDVISSQINMNDIVKSLKDSIIKSFTDKSL